MDITELIDHPPREDDPVDIVAPVLRRIRRQPQRPLISGGFIFSTVVVSGVLACGLDWLTRLRPLGAMRLDFGLTWSTVGSGGQLPNLMVGLVVCAIVALLFRRMVLA